MVYESTLAYARKRGDFKISSKPERWSIFWTLLHPSGTMKVISSASSPLFLFLFFLLDGTTVQCEISPPSWTPPSQLWFETFSFNLVIFRLLISVCTQFHHLCLVVLLVYFHADYFKYLAYFSFTTHSTSMTNPIQSTFWKTKVYINLQTAALIPYYIAFSYFHLL